MHSKWEELIPFYIAGTLPKADVTRLERHLSGCADCRKSLDEWLLIADVVRADAASQMRDLPPLSPQVLSIASQQAGERYHQPIPFTFAREAAWSRRDQPRYRMVVTLVAAAFTILLLGGLLALMVSRGIVPFRPTTPDADVVLLPTHTPSETITPVPSLTDTPASTDAPPSATPIPPSATIIPSQTSVPASTDAPPSPTPILPTSTPIPPSLTPVPPTATLVEPTRVPLSATPIPPSATPIPPSPTLIPPSLTPVPPTATLVIPTRVPPTNTQVLPTAMPQIIVIEPSATPVIPTRVPPTSAPTIALPTPIPSTRTPPTEIIPTFESLSLADATQDIESLSLQASSLAGTCTVQGAAAGVAVNLHAGPGDDYAILNAFTQDDVLIALAQSDNGWIRGQYSFDDVTLWVGWVRIDQVFLSGDCAELPVIPAGEAPTEVSPIPEATAEAPVELTPESTVESIEATETVVPVDATPIPPDSGSSGAPAEAPAVVITATVANLRSGPGTSYAIIATARAGDRFTVTAQTTVGGSGASSVWYLVRRANGASVWVSSSVAQLTPADALIPPALTIPAPGSGASVETAEPFETPEVASGSWSQTVTVLSSTCAEMPSGGTVPVSLSAEGDIITIFSADAGSPFAVSRIGAQTYSGSYVTATATVSISLTFGSATSYYGSAVSTGLDGCIVQSALSGVYAGS